MAASLVGPIAFSYGLFIDECYNSKMSHESKKGRRGWISSIVSKNKESNEQGRDTK